MDALEFDVAKRRAEPIPFKLGGDSALLRAATEAVPATDQQPEIPAQPEVRGKDDHVYTFTPPKSAVMLMPLIEPGEGGAAEQNLAVTKATFDWLGSGLSESDSQRIQTRLRDPKDDLDIDTLATVVQRLSENVGGRPTT